jgi:ribosomal protein S18 acetylase RimI-like enzyme
MTIRELTVADYEEALKLWEASEGVALSPSDTREQFEMFLERNPGLSFVACEGSVTAGVVLCGHDGRRGYIHHLAVSHAHRRRGIGEALVNRCLAGLRELAIYKCHLFVAADNHGAFEFWESSGWTRRDDLEMYSKLPDPA